MIIGAGPMTAPFATMVALKMGASALFVGLLYATHLGSFALQLLTIRQVRRIGTRRVIIFWHIVAIIIMLPILVLPEVWDRFPRQAPLYLVCVLALRHWMRALGVTGWMPLIQDNVPKERRGRFFGFMRAFWQITMLLWMVALAVLVGDDAPWKLIRIVFLIGIIGHVCFVTLVWMVADLPPLGDSKPLLELIRRPFSDRRYRWTLFYIFTYSLALGLSDPYRIVYLKQLEYGDRMLLFGPAALALGAILTLHGWGKLTDRVGNRVVFSVSHVAMFSCCVGWLFVDNTRAGMITAIAFFALIGVFNGGNGIALTRHIMGVIDRKDQASYLTITSVLGVATAGMAGLLGGVFLQWGESVSITLGSLELSIYHLLFMISGAMFVFPHLLRVKLREASDYSSTEVIAFITRPLRMMLGTIAVLPEHQAGNEPNGPERLASEKDQISDLTVQETRTQRRARVENDGDNKQSS